MSRIGLFDISRKKAQEDLTEIRQEIAKDAEQIRQTLVAERDVFADAISERITGG